MNIVDIHAHVLPGLDDGPRTLDESLRMCELYVQEGVTAVVATPHMADYRFDVTPQAVRQGVAVLSEACRQRGLDLEILPGGDVRLQPELLDMLDAGSVLTLADTGKYLLLELPLQAVPRVDGLIRDLVGRGVAPILSHPERIPDFSRRPARLAELVACGCLVQVTAGSLLGRFGRLARRTALRFLEADLAHVVAGDAHSARGRRRPEFGRVVQLLADVVGEDAARRLLETNPARILRGEPLPMRDADSVEVKLPV